MTKLQTSPLETAALTQLELNVRGVVLGGKGIRGHLPQNSEYTFGRGETMADMDGTLDVGEALIGISAEATVAFAAGCAERASSTYMLLERPEFKVEFQAALNLAWRAASGEEST